MDKEKQNLSGGFISSPTLFSNLKFDIDSNERIIPLNEENLSMIAQAVANKLTKDIRMNSWRKGR
ncbi:hypothetical protein [Ureibacillus sp. FSL E2-3493]|uniref:hypothetical protein n=1 Tax=Ureibacillus sp. FSL E2-3493 TaxID=2921367 RepID=UPI0031197951